MDTIKLKYHYYDYDFIVADHNLLDPDDSPCIALRRIEDGLSIGYTGFSRFVGTKPGDASHMKRLEAAARFLSIMLMHMDRFGIRRISDIPLDRVYEYLHIMCYEDEVVYTGEFIYNLARAGYMTDIKPEDMIFYSERG